jgi:hypothetical protein
LLLEQGQLKEAITELQTSVDQQRQIIRASVLHPSPRVQEAVYLSDLGGALRANGQYTNAIKTSLSLRSLAPWNGELLYKAASEIGRCLSSLSSAQPPAAADYINDHTALAITILQEAIDVGFHDKHRLQTDPALDKLRQRSEFNSLLKLKPRQRRHQQRLAKARRPKPATRRPTVQSSQRPPQSVDLTGTMLQQRAQRRVQKIR